MGGFRRPYIPPEYNYGPGRTIGELLMRGGDAQAQRAANSGAIWGGALQNIGATLAQGLEQYGVKKEEKRKEGELKVRDAAFASAVDSWDGKDVNELRKSFTMLDPKTALEATRAIVEFRDMGTRREADAEERDWKGLQTTAKFVSTLSDELVQHWAPNLMEQAGPILVKRFGIAPEALQQPMTPQQIKQVAANIAGGGEKQALVKGSPGDVFFDPVTKEQAFAVPAQEKPETRSLDVQAAEAMAKGDLATYDRLLKVKKEMGQADDRPRITVNAGGGRLSPAMESQVLNRLTNQWNKVSAPAVELGRQLDLMESGMAAAKAGDMNAGQQAVLVTFQKILDPTSVVREAEYFRSAAGQSLLKRIQGAATRLAQGGAGFTAGELEQFASLARTAVKNASVHVNAVKERIGKGADHYGIPRDLIFEDMPGTQPPEPARVSSDADYDKLPSGAEFVGPDGKRRRKP